MRPGPVGRGLVALALAAPALAQDPVPPYDAVDEFLERRNCVACHELPAHLVRDLEFVGGPSLERAGERLLDPRAFLHDPAGERPGTPMPDLLPGDPAPGELDGLWAFLRTLGDGEGPAASGASLASLERGRQLFHSVGCVACHEPFEPRYLLEEGTFEEVEGLLADLALERLAEQDDSYFGVPEEDDEDEPYVPPGTLPLRDLSLFHLGSWTDARSLEAFLLDPTSVRASGRMPDLGLTAREARDIATYLVRWQLGEGGDEAVTGGLQRAVWTGLEDAAAFDPESREPDRTDVTAGLLLDGFEDTNGFQVRWTGLLDVPASGEWTFRATSDDGSELWLDGRLVMENWSIHPPTEVVGRAELEAGTHAFEYRFFEAAGGESVKLEWEGPGQERAPVPADAWRHAGLRLEPRVEPPAAGADPADGARRFVERGCHACHTTGLEAVDSAPFPDPVPLEGVGCLTPTDDGHVRFAAEPELRAAVLARLAAPDPGAPDESTRVTRQLLRLGCLQCHRRADLGGVHPLNRDHFLAAEGADLGDEGRIPPDLTGVGAKLRPGALAEVLLEGRGVRPYMTARMPRFGEANVGWLREALPAVDPPRPYAAPAVTDAEVLRTGLRLVGTEGGLGCIQCHDFAGTPSLGIRAVDLATVAERLQPGWFRALLLDPPSVKMGTRMATLWLDGRSPVEDVYDGDPGRQVEAVWQLLQLGGSMPRPAGLNAGDATYELVPEDEVLSCGVFLEGHSPRAVVVGFPELVHYAYDVQHSRLAQAWRGRFFNAAGTWQGRAGSLERPPGDEFWETPPGMPLAELADLAAPWPTAVGEAAGFRAHARELDDRQAPTWYTRWDGRLVRERLSPLPDGRGLRRVLTVWSAEPETDLVLRVPDRAWGVVVHGEDGERRLGPWADADGPVATRVVPRDGDGGPEELRVRLDLGRGFAPEPGMNWVAEVELEVRW